MGRQGEPWFGRPGFRLARPGDDAVGQTLLLYSAGMTISGDPQQMIEPSVLTPQVYSNPALTEANSPPGGVAWPTTPP